MNIIHFASFHIKTQTHTHRGIQSFSIAVSSHFTCQILRFDARRSSTFFVSFSMECNNVVQFSTTYSLFCYVSALFLRLPIWSSVFLFQMYVSLSLSLSFGFNSLVFLFVRYFATDITSATIPQYTHTNE